MCLSPCCLRCSKLPVFSVGVLLLLLLFCCRLVSRHGKIEIILRWGIQYSRGDSRGTCLCFIRKNTPLISNVCDSPVVNSSDVLHCEIWVKTVSSYMFYLSSNQGLAHRQPVCYVRVGCCRTGCCRLRVVPLGVYNVVQVALLYVTAVPCYCCCVSYGSTVRNRC